MYAKATTVLHLTALRISENACWVRAETEKTRLAWQASLPGIPSTNLVGFNHFRLHHQVGATRERRSPDPHPLPT